jgi:hypothetical protein
MRGFLATVLSVIAAGVLLIAYGLIAPRAAAISAASPGVPVMFDAQTGTYQVARPMYASERIALTDGSDVRALGGRDYGVAQATPRTVSYASDARPVRAYSTAPVPRRAATRVSADRGRDWKKTAMVIGGTTAAGAGLGAIFGGKKGALIGAAIGGGASSIYEVRKR